MARISNWKGIPIGFFRPVASLGEPIFRGKREPPGDLGPYVANDGRRGGTCGPTGSPGAPAQRRARFPLRALGGHGVGKVGRLTRSGFRSSVTVLAGELSEGVWKARDGN